MLVRLDTPAGARAAHRRGVAAEPRPAEPRSRPRPRSRRASSPRPTTTAPAPSTRRPTRASARSAPPSTRKQIRAPFAGILGIRQVDLGQYLSAGDPIVPLQAVDPLYVNFAVPQQDVPRLRVGQRGEGHRRGPGRGVHRPHHRARFGGRPADAQRAGPGDAAQPEGPAPSRDVRRHPRRAGRDARPSSPSPPPPSATRPTATPSSWSPSSRTRRARSTAGSSSSSSSWGRAAATRWR